MASTFQELSDATSYVHLLHSDHFFAFTLFIYFLFIIFSAGKVDSVIKELCFFCHVLLAVDHLTEDRNKDEVLHHLAFFCGDAGEGT